MNQTKIEIESCKKCPFIVTFVIDIGENLQDCSYYKEYMNITDNITENKPDFCKVKNIIVEEED